MRSLYSDPASLQMARLYNAEYVPMIVRTRMGSTVLTLPVLHLQTCSS